MANTKEYKIVINGVQESIDAVKSLNDQLKSLEDRIKALESKSIGVKATASTGGGSKSSSTGSLSEEEKLERQINQLEEKRVAYSKEIYQNYLKAKDVLSDTAKEQKSIAAADRLNTKSYSNTIQGMKQELADIKSAMQTVDLGDTDQMDKMVQRAKQLTDELKKIEEAYGQFGRNVGNYSSAFDGLDKVRISVGGTVREFGSAREAIKTLNNELKTMALNGQQDTKAFKELRKTVMQLESAANDAKKPMDDLMDAMESVTAIASAGQGLSAFFGFDGGDIQRSIQKLVALQNIMKSIQTISKQMETGEGIGKWVDSASSGIDGFVTKLTGAEKRMGLFVGSTRGASVAINLFSKALKGIASLGIAVAIDLIVDSIGKLFDALKDWAKGDADLIQASDVLTNKIDAQNKALERQLQLINEASNSGIITSTQARTFEEQAYSKALDESSKSLKTLVHFLKQYETEKGNMNLNGVIGDKGVTMIGGFKDSIKSIDEFNKRYSELEERVGNKQALKSWFSSIDDAKDEFAHLNKLVGRDFAFAMAKFNDGTKEGTKNLIDYINRMDELTDGRYSRAIKAIRLDNEGLQQDFDRAWELFQTMREKFNNNPIVVRMRLDNEISNELDRIDPTRVIQRRIDKYTELLVLGVDDAGRKITDTQRKNIEKIIAADEKSLEKMKKQRTNEGRKIASAAENAQDLITRLEIDAMQDGLNKKLRQLDEEERQTINKLNENGRKSADVIAKIQRLYNEKRNELIRDYLLKLEEDVKKYAKEISDIKFDINTSKLKNDIDEISNKLEKLSTDQPVRNTLISNIETKEIKASYNVDDGKYEFAKRYKQLFDEAQATEDVNEFYRFLTAYIKDKDEELYKDIEDFNIAIYNEPDEEKRKAYFQGLENTFAKIKGIIEKEYQSELLFLRDYSADVNQTLSDSISFRLRAEDEYYEKVRSKTIDKIKEQAQLNKELIKEETEATRQAESDRYSALMSGLTASKDAAMKQMAAIEKRYKFVGLEGAESIKKSNEKVYKSYHELFANIVEIDGQIQTARKQHYDKLEEITKEGTNREAKLEIDTAHKIASENEKYFSNQISNLRDAQSKINELLSKQPVTNSFGIVNLTAAKKQYDEISKAAKEMSGEVIAQKVRISVAFAQGLIKPEAYNAIMSQLNDLESVFNQLFGNIENQRKQVIPKFIQSCQVYLNEAMNSFQTIMQAVWDAEDIAFEKQQDELDKWNEELDKKLDEQQEIVEKHKDAIDSIEDELATARGSRRQHLIDQINAEMEAQREARRQEQKIQKEKEKAEKKQEELDKKRKKAEYERNMLQAIVNGAMAVTFAAMNNWPVPAIPMMALAAATTAAQVAIMAANKPYAKGGVLEGPSHKQGGIPVGNTGIEVEGKEYVIRKKSTTPNVELLDMINRSERKLTLDDFINFYSSGKLKKNISSMSPKTAFADGGVIPTISNDIDINDRLISAMEAYAERPVVVSVVDINNRQNAVKNVQVLAGLE